MASTRVPTVSQKRCHSPSACNASSGNSPPPGPKSNGGVCGEPRRRAGGKSEMPGRRSRPSIHVLELLAEVSYALSWCGERPQDVASDLLWKFRAKLVK